MFKKKPKIEAQQAEAEAGAEGAEGGEHAAGAKKKPPMMLVLIAAAAVVLLGGGAGAYVFLLKPKPAAGQHADGGHAKKEKKEAKGEEAKAGPSPITEGPDGVVFYTMPDMVVNIQAPDSRPTFLKLKLAFELPDETVAERIEPNQPRLADMFQTFLRELRPEDLSGSQGSYQLRMEIQRRVNHVIAPARINAVLIQEMLIQ